MRGLLFAHIFMRILFPLCLIAVLPASASLAQVPALSGIAHVAFRVSDVPKSREFYQKLGFEQAFEFADPGKPPVSYMKVNDHQFIELYGRAASSQPTGLLHLCYEASDIEAVWKQYMKAALNPSENRKARAGNLLFILHDPEGQVIEFTQYLPGSLHFEDRGKHLGEHRISQHLLSATIAVRDVSVARAFYTDKLGFAPAAANDADRLRFTDKSEDQIELEPVTPAATPRIAFEVASLKRAAERLDRLGLSVHAGNDAVAVTDPDGAVILFVAKAYESRGKQ